MNEFSRGKPEILVTHQWAILETGYVYLSGSVEGLQYPATLRLQQNGEVLSECRIPGGGTDPETWTMERFSTAALNLREQRLTLFRGSEIVTEKPLTLCEDHKLRGALSAVKQRHTVKRFGLDGTTRTDNESALAALKTSAVELVCERLETTELRKWIAAANYGRRYPAYVREFPPGRLLEAKAAQHYLSARLSQPTRETVLMDAASSGSPFWKIIERLYNVSAAFRQDLNFREGVHGDTIGSDVAEIPLPDGCLSMVTSHCSWEHFEGNTDVAFLEECARLLRPGGTVIIIPIYFADRYAIQTSPHVWSSKYSKNRDCPEFDETSSIYLREEIRQRQSKYYTASVLIERVLEPLSDRFDFQIHYCENYREFDGCPAFALKATKT